MKVHQFNPMSVTQLVTSWGTLAKVIACERSVAAAMMRNIAPRMFKVLVQDTQKVFRFKPSVMMRFRFLCTLTFKERGNY